MSRWEVRLCIDDFDKSKIIRDNTFSLVEVKNKSFRIRDYEKDIKYICKSIDNRLEDWDGKPSLEVAKERLNAISNIFLFYHSLESKAIGWCWFTESMTHDWITTSHELPTKNSCYAGGMYIRKDINIPPKSGEQLYYHVLSNLLCRYKWVYGYADSWNRPSIYLANRCRFTPYNFIKE